MSVAFSKIAFEIEHRAERLTHLVQRAQDVCLALQRFENFVALRRDAATSSLERSTVDITSFAEISNCVWPSGLSS